MDVVKKSETYTIYKKRSGRYGIRDNQQKWVRGEEKVKILLAEKLIKLSKAKAKPQAEKEAVAPEATTQEAPSEAKAEAQVETAAAEAPAPEEAGSDDEKKA